MKSRTWVQIVIAAALIIAGGLLLGQLWSHLLPVEGSVEAGRYDELFSFIFHIAGVIFVLVEGLLVYSIIRFRRRPGDNEDGPPIHDIIPLEVAWTIAPFIIVTVLSIRSYEVLKDFEFDYSALGSWFHGAVTPGQLLAEPTVGGDLVVDVEARQFAWTFKYPSYGVTSNELHVPVNKLILARITSLDVNHAFWVPQFRIKKDAVPGFVTETRFTPSVTGSYYVVCAELCGLAHNAMRAPLIVQTQEEFDRWISQNAQGVTGADPIAAGRNLVTTRGCGSCHTLKDANVSGQVGPDLDGLGQRAGSRMPNMPAHDYVQQSLLDPKAFIVPGFMDVMPSFKGQLSDPELELLINYLLKQ